jgi:F-type H+-transporting ATPase subunit a
MELSPDSIIYWQWEFIVVNATLVFSWVVMGILAIGSWLITRNLSTEPKMSFWQNALETIISMTKNQIRDISQKKPGPFLPFIGTLFLFISLSNLLGIIPLFESPTGSLSTTVALALIVFFAVPAFGISQKGLKAYVKNYFQPTPIMAPFRIISEISRTFALAVRLFGNVMSGSLIVAILLSIVPLFVPVVLNLLELLIGQIQAYIFAVLAMVYISSAISSQADETNNNEKKE